MGRFQYSEVEMGLNKVLKMNLDVTESLMRDPELLRTRAEADESIASSMELLHSLGKSEQVDRLSAQIKSQSSNRKILPRNTAPDDTSARAARPCCDCDTRIPAPSPQGPHAPTGRFLQKY